MACGDADAAAGARRAEREAALAEAWGAPPVAGGGLVYPDIDPGDKNALIDRLLSENEVPRALGDV